MEMCIFSIRWASEEGRSLEKDAYIQLSRIYNSMANEMIQRTKDIEGEEDPQDEALNRFHKVRILVILKFIRKICDKS